MSQPSVQIDPLDSPHPIPWSWVLATLAIDPHPTPQLHYYRSHSLLSPNQRYAAYSRIQMQVQSEFFRSQVSSILFVENLETGDLQAITPTSPLADNPFLSSAINGSEGHISIVIPVSWSEAGDRLLARVFESLFCSDIASDYAVTLDQTTQQISTFAPLQLQYTNAVLLGWSQSTPGQVLFRVGNLGEATWHMYQVDTAGQATLTEGDRPVVFGQVASSVWMGPQRQG